MMAAIRLRRLDPARRYPFNASSDTRSYRTCSASTVALPQLSSDETPNNPKLQRSRITSDKKKVHRRANPQHQLHVTSNCRRPTPNIQHTPTQTKKIECTLHTHGNSQSLALPLQHSSLPLANRNAHVPRQNHRSSHVPVESAPEPSPISFGTGVWDPL